MWDSSRIGAGAAPIETEDGWLAIYHGADEQNRYCLGALLLDRRNPAKVLARSNSPIMEPIEDYEQKERLLKEKDRQTIAAEADAMVSQAALPRLRLLLQELGMAEDARDSAAALLREKQSIWDNAELAYQEDRESRVRGFGE